MDVSQLEFGQPLSAARFLLDDAAAKTTKSGKPYIAGTLRDATGRIELRQWEAHEHPPVGHVVAINGEVDQYEGDLQVKVTAMSIADGADPADYVESAHRPAADLIGEIVALAEMHCDGALLDLLLFVLGGNADRMDGLLRAPAAKRNHHARLGGLVEHIHSMAHLAVHSADHYARRYDYQIERGILLAGVILHDIGKADELSRAIGTEYTRSGRLEGHISMGVRLLEGLADRVGLDDETHGHIRHLILSHHGKKEWGSPVEPRTPEAVVLHQLDMLDSRADAVLDAASKADGEEAKVRRKTVYLRREGSE